MTDSNPSNRNTGDPGAATSGKATPVYGMAKELSDGQRYCTCCERKLAGKFRWLELDQRHGSGYHDLNDVPEDHSQGWFPFGLTCAKKLVKAEIKRRSALNLAKGEAR